MNIQEKIDAYFEGTLSGQEMRELELEVSKDPGIQKEFEMQKDIVDALKEVRVAELKTQLNDISINPGLFETTWVKVLTSLAIITGISIIGYFTFNKESTPSSTEIQQPELIQSAPEEQQTEEKTPTEPENSSKEKTKKEDNKSKDTATTPKPVTPNVIEDFNDDETRDVIDVPENNLLENYTFANASIEIEVKEGTQYNFHYKFVNNRLFLYGDFSQELYNILEIKSDSASQLFFSYEDQFYSLDKKQKEITPLVAIKDTELIQKLKSIRKED